MVSLITAVAAVASTWAILWITLTGLGFLFQRACGARARSADDILLAFWTGLSACILGLQLWHLFLPINSWSLAIMVAIGAIGLVMSGKDAVSLLRRGLRYRASTVCLILVVLWVADRAIGPGDAHDSGLYHYPVMRWYNTYAVVPGLGNLSSPYAVNNSSLLFAAMLDTGPWSGRANHIVSGLLLAMLGAQCVLGAVRLLRSEAGRLTRASLAADAMLVAPLVMLALGKEASSPKTDLPVGVMMLVMAPLLMRRLISDDAGPRPWDVFAITVMATASVTMKLSAAPFALCVWILAAGRLWLGRKDSPDAHAIRALGWSVLLSCLLMGSWIAGNCIMSGYPLFPSHVGGLAVDWKVPEANVSWLSDVICNHTKGELSLWLAPKVREMGVGWYANLMTPPFDDRMSIHGWEWLRSWFFTLPVSSASEVIWPACIAVSCGGWWALRRARARTQPMGAMGLALIPGLVAVAFWFFTAPGPRYAWPYFWSLAGVGVALLLASCGAVTPRVTRAVVTFAILAAVPVTAYQALRVRYIVHENPFKQIPFIGPGPDHGFHPLPTLEMGTTTSHWGLTVWTPKGDVLLVWNAPLPATAWPALDLNLQERVKGDLSKGFRIEPWEGTTNPPADRPPTTAPTAPPHS
jgi:hypothetical protein